MSDKLRLEVILAAVDKVTGPLKGVIKGSRETAAAVSEAQLALKKMEAEQRKLQRLQSAMPAMGRERNAMRVEQAKLDALTASGTATAKQIKAQEQALQQQTSAYERQRAVVLRLRAELNAMGVGNTAQAQQRLASGIAAANTQLELQNRKLDAQRKIEERLQAVRGKHEKQMHRIAMAGALAAGSAHVGQRMGGALMQPVAAFADSESASSQLKAAMMGADGSVAPEYQQILDKAKELGNRLPGTTADFIRMMTVLRQEGMSAKAVLGGLGDAAANLGVLLGTGPEEAATKMAKMQDSLRATEDEMGKVADLMQRAKYLGADMDFMQSAIGNAAPVMDVMKIQGAQAMQTIAPMAVMMNQAGMEDGGSVGNAVRKIYDRAMNSKKVGKANRELENAGAGFKLDFTDGRGEFGGLENLFDQLAKLRKLSTTDRGMVINALWGDDAETTRVLSKWIDSNLDGYRQTVEKMQAQADLQQRVNEQLGTLKNVADAAAGSYSNLLTELGASIAPELKAIITWLGEMAVGMGGWARENPKTTRAIMLTVAALGVLLTVAGAITMAIVAVLGPMTAARFLLGKWALGLLASRAAGPGAASSLGLLARAFSLVKPAVMGAGRAVLWLGRALLATPWGRVLSLLAFSATMVYNNWEGIKGGLVAIWDGITGRISEAISGGVGSWLALLLDFSPIGILHSVMAFGLDALGIELPARFSTLGGNLIRGLVGGITRALGWLNDTAAGLWNGLVSTAASVWGRITESISGLIDGGVAAWAARLLNFSPLGILWAGITAALTALGISVPAQFHSLGGFVVDGLIGGITSRAAALRDAVTGIASSAAEWFKEKLGIASPSRVFMEYGGWISEGAALGMQGGAGAVRTAALAVAAAAALPLQAAAVPSAAGVAVGNPGAALRMDTRPPLAMPAAQAAQPAAGGGTYHITINAAPGMDEKALARAVAAELDRRERAKRSRVLSAMSDID